MASNEVTRRRCAAADAKRAESHELDPRHAIVGRPSARGLVGEELGSFKISETCIKFLRGATDAMVALRKHVGAAVHEEFRELE